MSAQLKAKDEAMSDLLEDWAKWAREAKAAGWMTSDTLWRAQFARGGQPEGVPTRLWALWCKPDVKEVHEAMEFLRPAHKRVIEFVQAFHLCGSGPLVALGWTWKEIGHNVNAGHDLIRRAMA